MKKENNWLDFTLYDLNQIKKTLKELTPTPEMLDALEEIRKAVQRLLIQLHRPG